MAEKTEKPTPKHLREARKKGQIPRSAEVQSAAAFVAALIFLWLAAGGIWTELKSLCDFSIRHAFDGDFQTVVQPLLGFMFQSFASAISPLLIVVLIVAVIVGIAQARGVVAIDPVIPQINRLNPAEGLKRIFSKKTLATFAIMLVKFFILGGLIYWVGRGDAPDTLRLFQLSPEYIALAGSAMLLKLAGMAAILFIIMAVVDFGVQFHWFMQDMRQDKDEVKRDMKDMQGDPLIKSKRRALAMQMLFESLQDAVKKANVVVVNPTHVAVALYYDSDETPLPVVVAKGQDEVAMVIRTIAEQENIPIVQDIPLARRLYEATPVDGFITNDTFDAVAEVLVWARRLKEAQSAVSAEPEGDEPAPAPRY